MRRLKTVSEITYIKGLRELGGYHIPYPKLLLAILRVVFVYSALTFWCRYLELKKFERCEILYCGLSDVSPYYECYYYILTDTVLVNPMYMRYFCTGDTKLCVKLGDGWNCWRLWIGRYKQSAGYTWLMKMVLGGLGSSVQQLFVGPCRVYGCFSAGIFNIWKCCHRINGCWKRRWSEESFFYVYMSVLILCYCSSIFLNLPLRDVQGFSYVLTVLLRWMFMVHMSFYGAHEHSIVCFFCVSCRLVLSGLCWFVMVWFPGLVLGGYA